MADSRAPDGPGGRRSDAPALRQGARPLPDRRGGARRPAADGRQRPDLGLRLRPRHARPRQGRDPHRDVAVVVRPARRPGAQPRRVARRAGIRRGSGRGVREPGDVPRRVRGPRLPRRLRPRRLPRAPARSAAIALPRGAAGRLAAARADLHPGHQGRLRRPRRERRLRRRGGDRRATTSPPSCAADPRRCTPGPRRSPAARGIILADTKVEFGHRADGTIVLADEVLTPDSSRFWPAAEWEPGRAQASYDKQIVRDWLLSPASGWDRASGEPPPPLPDEVVARTRARYVEAYELLTGATFRPQGPAGDPRGLLGDRRHAARRPRCAFTYLVDPRNRPEWQASLLSVRLDERDAEPAVGLTWRDTWSSGSSRGWRSPSWCRTASSPSAATGAASRCS